MKTKILKIAIEIFFLNILFFSVSCQNKKTDSNINIKELLPEGKILFEILDVEISDRQMELTEKFQKAYQENFDVFNAYFEKTRNKQNAKYPENEILSEKEWLEYVDFLNNVRVVPTQIEIVEVIYSDDNSISFKSDGILAEIFSKITYNVKTNTFNLDNRYKFKFKNSVNVEKTTNAFGESWQGYNWEFAEGKNIDLEADEMPNMENLDKMSIMQYKITLGKLSSGKTFMNIKLKDLRNSVWFVNFEVVIRMK